MEPPFALTPETLDLCLEASRLVGKYEGLMSPVPQPQLRKSNRIRTIQGSLAIEGNTLSLDQVTAILSEQRVVGPPKDILEVQNAIRAYEGIKIFKPESTRSLLKAHKIMMEGLIPEAGRFRKGSVGIMKGSKVSHVAPPASRVPELIENLFSWIKKDRETPQLIKSCIAHYEIEFIHPFSDGNGRMGRFWQHLMLVKSHPIYEYVPFESVIRKEQKSYYHALEQSDRLGESTPFVVFSLRTLVSALTDFIDSLKPEPMTSASRLELARQHFGGKEFSRKDYITLFKTISTATGSRDLKEGVREKLLKKTGEKAVTTYRFNLK